MRIAVAAMVALAGMGVLDSTVRAQASASAESGVYSEAQAKRGQEQYEQACAECHGASLTGGGDAPTLSGSEFTAKWAGLTVGDLLEKIELSMPAGNPRRVGLKEKVDILAYILGVNAFPPGAADLAGDIDLLKKIPFDGTKP